MLVIGGVLLHASSQLEPTPLFDGVEIVSESFRMGAFYGIAGFLSAATLRRRDDRWLRQRIMQLAIPAVVGVATICPLVWLLIVTQPGGPRDDPAPPFAWLHLWFLFGLIVYSLAAAGFDRLDRRLRPIDRLVALHRTGTITPLTILLVVAVAVAALFAVAPVVMRASMPMDWLKPFAALQLIAGYLPMFLLGFVLARADDLRTAMLAAWRAPLAIVLGVALSYLVWFVGVAPIADEELAGWGGDHLRFVGAALCPPAAFVLILRSALSIERIAPLARSIADASYTIYILHLPIAVAITTRLGGVAWSPYVKYALAVTGAGLGSYAFHRLLVRRWGVLRLVLNGRWSARSRR